MQSIYAVEISDIEMLKITLERLKSDTKKSVILRVSFGGWKFSPGNFSLNIASTYVMMSDNEKKEIPYPLKGLTPNEALKDAIETTLDKDINFNMGFTSIEVPENSEINDIHYHCLPNLEALITYLNQIGAVYRNDWIGKEERLGATPLTEKRTSNLCFTTISHHYLMDKDEAIAYITSAIAKKDVPPKFIKESGEIKTRIYILQNPSCLIPFIKGDKSMTSPSTKQRLLFIYDRLKYWCEKWSTRWVEIEARTAEKFSITLGKNANWETKKQSFTPNKFVVYPEYSLTNMWDHLKFAESLEDRLIAMIEIMARFGIKININNFTGATEDYIDRQTYKPAERTTTIVQKPKNRQ